MTRSLFGAAPLLLAPLVFVSCASEREQVALDDWEALSVTFRPAGEVVAITSHTTLSDYVALALERSPLIKTRAQEWRAGLDRIPQARSLPDPQLSYGEFLEPVETRIGPQRRRYGVSQRVPWPGKLIGASEVALERSEAARARVEGARREVVARVTEAYADYYYLGREVAVTEEILGLVQHWEAVAQTRLRTGARGGHSDVIKAQVEIGRLEDRVASLRDARRPRVERLRALLDLPPETELPWPTQLPERRLERAEADLLRVLPEASPLLAELDSAVAASERGVDLAWQGYFPDFMFGLDYVEVDRAKNIVRGSGDDAVLAKVGLSLPIWFGKNDATVSEAKARLRVAQLQRRDTENTLQSALSRALFAYRDAVRKLSLYRDSLVPKAEQSLKAVARAFETGQGDFLDVLDAERVLLEFHLARERALVDRLTSLAVLERLIGIELGTPRQESR